MSIDGKVVKLDFAIRRRFYAANICSQVRFVTKPNYTDSNNHFVSLRH